MTTFLASHGRVRQVDRKVHELKGSTERGAPDSHGERCKGCDIGTERAVHEVTYYREGAFPKEGQKPTET